MKKMLQFLLALRAFVILLVTLEMVSGSADHCEKPCYCSLHKTAAACNSRHLRYIPRLPPSVTSVKLIQNTFPYLDRKFFQNLTLYNQIERLNLTDNLIQNISADAFADFHNLKVLEFSREPNLNTSILKASFKSLNITPIRTLILSDHRWPSLPSDMFEALFSSNISALTLTLNNFRSFNLSIFSGFKGLTTLILASNVIRNIEISELHSLTYLILEGNFLYDVPHWCYGEMSLLPKLQILNLNHNSIAEIDSSSFRCLEHLQSLHLDNNNIEVLKNNTFSVLEKLETLHISHNTRIRLIEGSAFNISTLKSLYFIDNSFHFDKGNKYNPKTLFYYCSDLTMLELSNNFLPSVPEVINDILSPLTKIKKLILFNTRLRRMPPDIFPKLKFLTTLNLQSNYILGWSNTDRVFGNESSIKILNLGANNIRLVNETSFPPSLLNSLTKLDLSNNYFSCTCDQMWFRDWIRKNIESRAGNSTLSLGDYPSAYACVFPSELKGVLLQQYNPTVEMCTEKNQFIIIAIVATPVITCIAIVVIVLYKCQTNIRNYIYLRTFHKNMRSGYIQLESSEDYEYHAFIVYCEADRDWVHNKCLYRLETEEEMKLCIHHRDFDIGAPVTGNIANYMSKCRKVIVVMSNNFTESQWCQWEVDLVLERRRRQGKDVSLLIMLQSIDSKHMTDSVKALINSTSRIEYCSDVGEHIFWKALIEWLRKPIGLPPYAVLKT